MDDWFEHQESDCLWKFSSGYGFDEILASKFRCLDFLEWVNAKERRDEVCYTDVGCCVSQKVNGVSPFDVSLTLIVKEKEKSPMEHTIVVSGRDVSALETTMSSVVRWLSQDSEAHLLDVKIQAFASQPRQAAPALSKISRIGSLGFHFLHLAEPLQFQDVKEIEFRQCTHAPEVWASHSFVGTHQRVTLSCSMPELDKFVLPQSVPDIHLVLHFFLTGAPWDKLCASLQNNSSLQSLSIQYLDISDADWMLLMTSLRGHSSLQSLTMGFTDGFVDNYRRLTPERRRARSEAVLSTARANERLTDITWPAFQQDEEVAEQIEECLASRRD